MDQLVVCETLDRIVASFRLDEALSSVLEKDTLSSPE